MKRLLDILVSFTGLVILSPLILILLLLIYLNDFHSPFYRPIRVGKNRKNFRMLKFRTMVANADKIGGSSTSARDPRITYVGHFIRNYKLDEIAQLWNVLLGDMSLVGPRPQVKNHIDTCYTEKEMELLMVRPGVTDLSSIVFSDEGEILKDSVDVDLDYNQLIRPWKSRLGLIYIENQSFFLDIQLILLTIIAIFNKEKALVSVNHLLRKYNVEEQIITVCLREKSLYPFPPPGT